MPPVGGPPLYRKMRWSVWSTDTAAARVLKGLESRPSPLVAAFGLTNQMTGPLILTVAIPVVHTLGSGSPLSQAVKGKLNEPVMPGAGSKSNAPACGPLAVAVTVPTPATVVVMIPPTGAVPLTVPSVKV